MPFCSCSSEFHGGRANRPAIRPVQSQPATHPPRVVVVRRTEPLGRNRSWAGSAGIDVAPEVMKALTKVDPTYRDHALTELRDRLCKYRANELLGD
jgi:purine nucleoside permease